MAKRVKKKVFKPQSEAKTGYKTINGVRTKYIYVTIRKGKKSTTKGYKYRGGKKEIYIKEAKLPKGTKYYIDYRKGQIIKSPRLLERVLKKVKAGKKQKVGKSITRKKPKKLPKFMPVIKRVRSPPEPPKARQIVDMMDGKIFYEREHSLTDFASRPQEDKFLLDILARATKRKGEAKKLLDNFQKIRLKMSYSVEIHGVDETGRTSVIGAFTAIGVRPSRISQTLKDTGLVPQADYVDIDSNKVKEYNFRLAQNGIAKEQQQLNKGRYRITDVKIVVKFYNNPQKRLT